jgi:hypothetical protein
MLSSTVESNYATCKECRCYPCHCDVVNDPVNHPKVTLAGGAMTSSKIPRIEMIPYRSLLRLAARFELGEERHKDASWNGMKPENAGLKDKNTMVVRAAHAMLHASKLIAILTGQIQDDGDDHASAIMWAGAFLCESDEMEVRKREREIGRLEK